MCLALIRQVQRGHDLPCFNQPTKTHKKLRNCLKTLFLAAIVFSTACETAPPVQEMSDARQAISVAKEAGAEKHAYVYK